jgi:alanyl-tRNA synthetase
MTIRLYYGDSYLKEFSAVVLAAIDKGGNPAVILDRTAFYPTSGGQPHDTGVLGSARVLNVEEAPSGEIVHVLDSPLQPGPVSGRVDWERRFDHMQQHTGQHILSQAFILAAQAPTVSFHLGQETSTIDLDLPDPSASVLEKAEHHAASIVFENRPVQVLKVDRARLSELGVRK